MELTFASYNIHKAVGLDGRRDPESIIAVLRELHADVIALQETDRRFRERESVLPRSMLDDTPWRPAAVARRPRSLGWHGNALLVRKDIDIELAEPVDLPTLEPRGAIRTDLLVEGRHFRRDWSGPVDIGVKAAAQNLADVAAMGATPTGLLVGLAAPGDLPADWALDLVRFVD